MEPQAVVELPEAESAWEGALAWAVGWLAAEGLIPPDRRDEAAAALIRRERLGSTVIRAGAAIPHTRLPHLARPVYVLFTSARGVAFLPNATTPNSDAPVTRMHLALHTADDPAGHLRRLQAIVERVMAEPG